MAGGLSLLLFGFFYWLVEACGLAAVAFFFIVIGMNAIAIYIATEGMVDFAHTGAYLFSGAINGSLALSAEAWRDVLTTAGTIAVEWFCLWFLWRKKIFIRV